MIPEECLFRFKNLIFQPGMTYFRSQYSFELYFSIHFIIDLTCKCIESRKCKNGLYRDSIPRNQIVIFRLLNFKWNCNTSEYTEREKIDRSFVCTSTGEPERCISETRARSTAVFMRSFGSDARARVYSSRNRARGVVFTSKFTTGR